MQGNRDGSWSATGGSGRGNGGVNGVPGGYRPQTTPVFSNFNLQQPISYPLTQFPANFFRPNFPDLSSFSLGNANFQTHQNLNFHHPQIPHQFGAGANVFLQPHGQSFSFPPQPPRPNNDISGPQNRGASGALESSSLKRRRQEVVHGSDVVVKETPKSNFASGESANSFSVSLPIPPTRVGTDDSGGSRIHGGNRSLEKCSAKPKRKVEVARIDKAVNKTRKAVVAAGESVSSTRVSRSVLEELEAESWRSLGVQMQDVPSLRQLMALEGKINAFIHCFVGARRIVTLHDLEVAICRNEFVDSFNDLELGPLLQHPLVLLYFPSISSSTSPVQITSEEIISLLDSYLYTYHKDDVKLDEFLNFVAEKKSVTSKEKLGVRIQSLRMYISFILDAKRQEGEKFKILLTELHQKYHFSSSKKQRQDKSLTVSERADSFALHHKDYCGKHIRFYSSDSDDNDSVDYEVENLYSSDNISSCPYPSVAEEMKRLGGSNKKRKAESCNYEKSDSSKLLGRGSSKLQKGNAEQEIPKSADVSDAKQVFNVNEADFTLSEGALRLFISTWKDTCKELSISTFVEKMLSFYDLGGIDVRAQNKRAKVMSSFPFVGLLNVAVTSMRRGMWDSIYDNLQMTSQSDTTNPGTGSQVGDIKPSEIRELNKTQHSGPPKDSNTVEEIIRRLSLYFKHDLSGEKPISIFRKLQTCEVVLAEQFQVQDFESLGWGGFFAFLENHMLLLPVQLKRFLAGELREECPLEVHVNQNLLSLLLSQASEFSGGNVTSIQMLVQLLTDQFPSINFKVEGNDLEEKFTEIIGRYKKKSGSKCVLYSATLLGAENSLTRKHLEEHPAVGNDTESRSSPLTAISSKEIVDVFLSVPLLSDLKSWCHWDLRFAPQFGPLMGCLNEINSKDLLCLVTRDGKIIRTDPSATADSFLEAALQGSAYRTAAQLLSVISLNGRTHLPFSLLKCYAKRAFEVFLDNHSKEMELNDRNTLVHMRGPVNLSASLDKMIVSQQKTKVDKNDYAASKFLLDCLGYLPGEFRSLAVDILLSGLRSVVKDAPTRVLSACELTEQRIMLHDTGLLLGVVEWINDYHEFCSSPSPNSAVGENDPSNLDSGAGFVQKEIIHTEQRSMNVSEKSCDYKKGPHESCHTFNCSGASCDSVKESVIHSVPEFHDNPASVIDLIRRDEFGLDSSSSGAETSMLQKQHARLGRALQCLSQELYSQDSHFILELVQNADDNRYPEHVEPTLTFILQKTGIVVLNNECGFMPENIRALCDVGRSTKKGSGGYIGKKGIGFKSVFRVSDAPEIHSNGFHFKFDISDGQIGYILPTVVPPHDIESLNSLLSGHALQLKDARWNTCITLPFRTIDSERTTVNHIEPMFSDLHPSLLLFLHRLQCIVYRNMLDDSLLVMRKEVVSENIVNISCGKNSMTWFVASEKLKAVNLRDGVQTTEISIGFTLDMLEDGTYRSCMIQEPVFAFLPLRTYGLKFIIQGDFILTSSREDVDEDSPWNQWLLSEFPSLFVSALRSFCSLPSFTQNPGKAVSSYMQLVPLVGEVHGFFSSLPRSIISRLRTTNCLLLEGDNEQWVPPCKVLRNWNEKISVLLKNGLLQEHLALGFLNKDIVLSDSLSRALGIEDYGPKTLVQILSSLSHKKDCLQSMGFAWLSSILTELYILFRSSGHGNVDLGIDKTLLDGLQKIPFIPLSNGKFTSLDEGAVWLHHDTTGFDLGDVFEAFPMLYGNLRTVDHSFLFASSVDEKSQVDDLVNMLCALGIQKLSAHEVIKVLILPAFEAKSRGTLEGLMVDYLCFVMTHLRSGCHVCHSERMYIISELRSKAPILSNYGLKQLAEVTIHFGEEYGNQINMKKVTKNLDILWHVVDGTYLNHPASKYYACGLKEWREFFQEIGIADFVQVVQVEKSIAELCSVSRSEKYDTDLLSPELAVRDWESPELVHLMSLLRKSNGRKCCKHLLGILDKLWDDCYHDKKSVSYNLGTPGVRSSESSFMRLICDSQWIVSSMDNKLHFAKDLYHDCDDVRSILGTNAPYAIPKVTSVKLVTDIGFKTKVCLDDALEILDAWVQCGDSFKSSISEITRFYKFLWNEMADSKQKITEKLHTLPSVFVPHNIGSGQNDQISGIFMSLDDVYWNDSAGVLDEVRGISSQISSVVESLHRKTLCNIYPGLHDFFVNGCGVPEAPSFQEYLNILGHFAHYVSPSCAAKAVFKIFLKWTDDLKSGKSSDDVVHFKKRLSELEYTVLPTENDKWVSLHSSFGLVCWCDDEKLKKRFKKKDNIQFIYFGENSDEEQEMLQTKVSVLMRSFGIPSISEVVKREAKYEGLQDNSITVSLVNWSLPYAQRYIFTLHHEKYSQTRKSVYSQVKRLQVVVVEKLCYRNVIPQYDISSKKEFKCSSLLQDKALYTTPDLDSHSLFMELSRLFFNGVPDLHLANFLHLIKTMAESGLSDEQMESFIVNSQKVHKIPDGEKIWFLKSALKAKKKAGISLSWLPSSSKTGHGSSEAHVDDSNKNLASGQVSSSEEDVTEAPEKQIPIELRDTNLVSGYDNCAGTSLQAKTPNPLHSMHKKSGSSSGNQHAFHLNSNLVHELNNSFFSPDFSERDQLHTGTPWAAQALQTGRKGEEIAYRYFVAKYGKEGLVRWVNEHSETGLPYDLMIENRGGKKEYVEVKATVSTRKDYFNLTVREWQFANEKGDSYIIAHVLLGNSNAILTQHRNPVKLCQEGLLRLLVLMPNQRNEINVAF